MGMDTGTEQVPFARDFLFSSMAKGALGLGNISMLDGFLYHGSMVVADFGYNPYIFEAGKSVVY